MTLPDHQGVGFRGPLLRSVSRSFYLSIRLLPGKLRDPIGLAYLLARATDTIADTAKIPASARRVHLETLARLIQREAPASAAPGLIESFAPLQEDTAERRLIEQLPACLAWLDLIAPADRVDIRNVLRTINAGQALDVERFGEAAGITALRTAAELDKYTYLVAGCVGEFWTNVCFRHLPRFATEPQAKMVALGIDYGKGLQLINILRDVGADLRAGRCYLPAMELQSLGIEPQELQSEPARAEPVLQQWHEIASRQLAAGLEYACAIRSWRVRLATALPALIGARTLALLRAAGAAAFDRKIKMTRHEVRSILLKNVVSFASPRTIREQFRQLSS